MDITVNFNIPRSRLRDILTTAVEQGIGYWANDGDFKTIVPSRNAEGQVTAIRFVKYKSKVPAFAAHVTIAGHRDCVAIVDEIELATAIGNALRVDSHGNNVNNSAALAAVAEMWTGAWDANTADVLVQFALFGEVVYG